MDWRFFQQKAQAKSEAGSTTRRSKYRLRQLALAFGFVLVAAVGVGTWFFSSQDRGPARGGSQENLASTAFSTARDVGAFLRENVTRDLANIATMLRGPGEDTPGDADEELADTELRVTPQVASPTPSRRRLVPVAPPELQVGLGRIPWVELPLEAPLFMVFDSSHPDVIPPGAGDIRLRSEFLSGSLGTAKAEDELKADGGTNSGVEQVGLVEIIVSEVGEVERARLISVPQNVHESMLLSAIKAWRFTPAMKDGMNVRYRQLLPIMVAR